MAMGRRCGCDGFRSITVEHMVIDENDNIYFAGFGDGNFGSFSNSGSAGFIGNISTSGNYQWILPINGNGNARISDIVVDDEWVYVSGNMDPSVTLGSTTLTSYNFRDTFISRVSKAGAFDWIEQIETADDGTIYNIELSDNGDLHIAHSFDNGWIRFGDNNFTSNGTAEDIILMSMSSDGEWKTASQHGGNSWDRATDIFVSGTNTITVHGYNNNYIMFGDLSLSSAGPYFYATKSLEEDHDDDNDGVSDLNDLCSTGLNNWTSNPTTDWDGDGCHDLYEDDDDDNDGVLDLSDVCSQTPLGKNVNSDGCADDDLDGVVDSLDLCHDGISLDIKCYY